MGHVLLIVMKLCDTCYEYSADITNQKCETCKINYILDSNRNCISPPTTIITTILTTISTTYFNNYTKKNHNYNPNYNNNYSPC